MYPNMPCRKEKGFAHSEVTKFHSARPGLRKYRTSPPFYLLLTPRLLLHRLYRKFEVHITHIRTALGTRFQLWLRICLTVKAAIHW